MPSRVELVAHGRDTESIAKAIGADLVIFQTLPDLISSVRQFNPDIVTFDCSVFTGDYITGGVDESYLGHLEGLRADNVKGKVVEGDIGVLDGKGGGGAIAIDKKATVETNGGPTNGADDTVGLHNSWKAS